MNIQEYIKAIDEQWQTGNATEHSYRPALQQLLSEMLPQHTVTNEPSRRDCGAPDYIISQKKGAKQPVFFVEAKDLFDGDLDGMRQHKEQFNRYKSSLDYIVFTDYLDFHVYEHGEWVKNIRIGEQQGNHIRMIKGVEDDFTVLIAHLADSKPTPITSPSRLAKQMAAKARLLANVVSQAFENAQDASTDYYHENTQLEGQLEAFRSILIHELEPTDFADIYAQTVAYGMFAARLHDETPEDFSRQEAAELIPKTNPFLRQIFQQIAGYDLDDRIAWIVDDLAQTFLVTDVEKVMKTYSGNSLHSDPMIHFYEDFLSEYNPKLRKSKGVWYTPLPVVQFIVRAVDEILQRDFHLPMGLADYSKVEHEVVNDQWNGKKQADKTIKRMDHRVQILDPATGTGTFLAEVVSQIYAKFQGMQGMWQGYVEEHLLPRLHGFE
ncbi:MAG: DNA methyltransferase, partial [Bacteroidales bacterium]|nr:DNA methyltransferase [Candidatus Cacconaster merdequi]